MRQMDRKSQRRPAYGHSAYWYAYHYGWTYSEAGTYTGRYLDIHTYRPRMRVRADGEWHGEDWFAWRNAGKEFDSTFNPFMFAACIATRVCHFAD